MKIARILALLICMGVTVFLPNAQAAFFSVTPSGSFDAETMGVTTITYDIYLNVEPGQSFAFISWDILLAYDSLELTNWSASNVLAGNITEIQIGSLNHLFFSLSPVNDVYFPSAGPFRLASITFDITDPLRRFDGKADFWVVSQIGDFFHGFTTQQGQFFQFPGVNGADVGRPLPDPDPAALMGAYLLLLLKGL